jgi:hypothetical protein
MSLTMLVTCTCGKKLVFGEEPNEQQVCDRCGQKVSSPLGAEAERAQTEQLPERKPAAPPSLPKGALPHRFATSPISSRILAVRNAREPRGSFGCVIVLLVLVALVVGGDFVVNPFGELACGHRGKTAYLYNLIPLGHTCDGLKALQYLAEARREIYAREAGGNGAVGSLDALQAAQPANTPYVFALGYEGLIAFPRDEASALPSFLLQNDGTVRMNHGADATGTSQKTGTLRVK